MREVALQLKGKTLVPFSREDQEAISSFKDNQIITAKLVGVTKQRSYQQLKLFWACCRAVVDNTQDQHWDTKEKVAFQIKVALQFIDMEKTIVSNNTVYPHFRSISFKNLPHLAACNFFDRAFVIMAKKLGVTPAQLLENAEV